MPTVEELQATVRRHRALIVVMVVLYALGVAALPADAVEVCDGSSLGPLVWPWWALH